VEVLSQPLSFNSYRQHLINVNLIWLVSSNLFQLYNKDNIKKLEQIFRGTFKSISIHLLFFIASIAFLPDTKISGVFFVLFYAICCLNFVLSRFLCTVIETIFTRRYKIRRTVAVMGMNKMGYRLASFFEFNKKQYAFHGFLDSEDSMYVDQSGCLLPHASEQIKKAAQNNIREVYVSLTADRMNEASNLIQEAERQCVRLKLVPDFSNSLASPFKIKYMGEFPVISLRAEPLEEMENRFRKRVFDLAFSSFVIVFILSWLFPLIALAIVLQSKGPVLFKQLRNGRDNKPFYCYKFRSMKMNQESDTSQAGKSDDRITSFGRFLRQTSLDELPQFFNVLRGNMSVVGPRPHMLNHTEKYRAIIDKYMVRHYLKPGITGWAQVNGFRGETISPQLMEKRVEHDIWYLENWSSMLDVKIIFLTIINIIRGEENAY
jgi:putative colanic acid biosynthesis UDP-glucose lipid carrier transferase